MCVCEVQFGMCAMRVRIACVRGLALEFARDILYIRPTCVGPTAVFHQVALILLCFICLLMHVYMWRYVLRFTSLSPSTPFVEYTHTV